MQDLHHSTSGYQYSLGPVFIAKKTDFELKSIDSISWDQRWLDIVMNIIVREGNYSFDFSIHIPTLK